MKKKVSPIKLHNLSETEMGRRELNLLRGGSGTHVVCPCISACIGSNCTCGSGGLSSIIKQADADGNEERQSTGVTSMNNKDRNQSK